MLSLPIAQPKPVADHGKRRRRDTRRMREFRDAVWALVSDSYGWANCYYCRSVVRRGSDIFRGEVHHILPRSTHPELKYEPANGCVSCEDCHRKQHA